MSTTVPDDLSDREKNLLENLKAAFCYMPTLPEVTQREYAEYTDMVHQEVVNARATLTAYGIDPDALYAQMNPPSESKPNAINTLLAKEMAKVVKNGE
jgi:hypothetical protein